MKFPAEQVLQTCADGLRAQYVGAMTFEHIRRYVDDVVTVSEEEIMQAVRVLAENPKTVAEPSGAVATAAWLFHRESLPKSNFTVAVISGVLQFLNDVSHRHAGCARTDPRVARADRRVFTGYVAEISIECRSSVSFSHCG